MIAKDENLINSLIKISRMAGDAILNVYNSSDTINIDYKSDQSPLTLADKNSHKVIQKALSELTPDIPILSEEGKQADFEVRKKWDILWVVDPLDGTKEFIKQNGEFTVNIALVEKGVPTIGVVYAPALNILWYGSKLTGAIRIDQNNITKNIHVNKKDGNDSLNVVVSRSHLNPLIKKFVEQFKNINLISIGSSIKMCYVADGTADLYPRLGPTMEWDTAAAHAVIKFAGGDLLDFNSNQPLIYNKESLLNPKFLAIEKNNQSLSNHIKDLRQMVYDFSK